MRLKKQSGGVSPLVKAELARMYSQSQENVYIVNPNDLELLDDRGSEEADSALEIDNLV